MDKKELCNICKLNEHCQHNFDYQCKEVFDHQNKNIFLTIKEYNQAKEYFKPKLIKCEFFDICTHKEINGSVKYHCNDIMSLTESYAYCIIRKKVFDILE
jgi:hypothetical protein